MKLLKEKRFEQVRSNHELGMDLRVMLNDRSLVLSLFSVDMFVDAYFYGCLGQNQFGSQM